MESLTLFIYSNNRLASSLKCPDQSNKGQKWKKWNFFVMYLCIYSACPNQNPVKI